MAFCITALAIVCIRSSTNPILLVLFPLLPTSRPGCGGGADLAMPCRSHIPRKRSLARSKSPVVWGENRHCWWHFVGLALGVTVGFVRWWRRPVAFWTIVVFATQIMRAELGAVGKKLRLRRVNRSSGIHHCWRRLETRSGQRVDAAFSFSTPDGLIIGASPEKKWFLDSHSFLEVGFLALLC